MKLEFISKKSITRIIFLSFYLCFASNVYGVVLNSRDELLSELGTSAITEDFESYIFPANTAKRVGTVLDADSIIEGQGPGLVCEGVRFMEFKSNLGLQWDRQFQYGLQSAALVTDGELIVDFISPVTHFGFDMFWFDVYPSLEYPATVQVLGVDKLSLLYEIDIFEPFAPDFFFFGFADEGGIGRIVLFRDQITELGVSPIIDNLTFGIVPEPATFLLFVLGSFLLRKRKV
jgi:hypothetical protein